MPDTRQMKKVKRVPQGWQGGTDTDMQNMEDMLTRRSPHERSEMKFYNTWVPENVFDVENFLLNQARAKRTRR